MAKLKTGKPKMRAVAPKRVILTADSIHRLGDGHLGSIIDFELNRIFDDMSNRPNDRKPREITLVLKFKPLDWGEIQVESDVKTKIPAMKPPNTKSKLDSIQGGIVFNPENAAQPDQMSMEPDTDDDDGDEVKTDGHGEVLDPAAA